MSKSEKNPEASSVAKCAKCDWSHDVVVGQVYDWDEVKAIADKHTEDTGHRAYMAYAKPELAENAETVDAHDLVLLASCKNCDWTYMHPKGMGHNERGVRDMIIAHNAEFDHVADYQPDLDAKKALSPGDKPEAKKTPSKEKKSTPFGNRHLFKLLNRKMSNNKCDWMESTEAMEIPQYGCVIKVSKRYYKQISISICHVPGVRIQEDVQDGKVIGRRLRSLRDE